MVTLAHGYEQDKGYDTSIRSITSTICKCCADRFFVCVIRVVVLFPFKVNTEKYYILSMPAILRHKAYKWHTSQFYMYIILL